MRCRGLLPPCARAAAVAVLCSCFRLVEVRIGLERLKSQASLRLLRQASSDAAGVWEGAATALLRALQLQLCCRRDRPKNRLKKQQKMAGKTGVPLAVRRALKVAAP